MMSYPGFSRSPRVVRELRRLRWRQAALESGRLAECARERRDVAETMLLLNVRLAHLHRAPEEDRP